MVPLIAKYLWRKGYLRVPDNCTVADSAVADSSACRTSCPSELYTSRGMMPYDVLMDVSAVHWFAGRTSGAVVRAHKERLTRASMGDVVACLDVWLWANWSPNLNNYPK